VSADAGRKVLVDAADDVGLVVIDGAFGAVLVWSGRREPPRLWLRARTGRPSVFVILDGGREIGTGCGVDQGREAEEALARYLAFKHEPDFADGDPRRILVADAVAHYIENLDEDHNDPEATHVRSLMEHFGEMTCDQVTGACKAYVKARTAGVIGRGPVKDSTARRELDTLSAALNFAWKTGKMDRPVAVLKPEAKTKEARWLTRSEAARLIWGALGFAPTGFDVRGQVTGYKRVASPQYHVARFILIALYTATRHAAVLRLCWEKSTTTGHIDFRAGRIHRRGEDERQTRKPREPCPIPDRLLPHLLRWRRLTVTGPCEYAGEVIQRQKTGFEAARERARLGNDVTPHTLKHTCITWLLQAGVPIWEVAGFTSTSAKLIERHYGHHCPGYMEKARVAFSGRRKGRCL